MTAVGQSNGGFRPQELSRRRFQETTMEVVNLQAGAIASLQAKTKAQGELLADHAVGQEAQTQRWVLLEDRVDQLQKQLDVLHVAFANYVKRSRWQKFLDLVR